MTQPFIDMMQPFIDTLAARLPAGLIHPGDPDTNQQPQALPLPGLSSTGIPPEMAAHFAEEAGLPGTDAPRLIAEAIAHLITTELDCTLITNTELAERQAADDTPGGTRIITVHTPCDRSKTTPILELAITNADRVVIPCNTLAALHTRSAECPHKTAAG